MISFLFLLQREEGTYLSKGPFKDEPSMNIKEFSWKRNDIRIPPPIGRLPMRGGILKNKKKFPPFGVIRWNKWWRVLLLLKDTILGMERNWNRLLVVAERESASKCNSNPQASHEWDNFFPPSCPDHANGVECNNAWNRLWNGLWVGFLMLIATNPLRSSCDTYLRKSSGGVKNCRAHLQNRPHPWGAVSIRLRCEGYRLHLGPPAGALELRRISFCLRR